MKKGFKVAGILTLIAAAVGLVTWLVSRRTTNRTFL